MPRGGKRKDAGAPTKDLKRDTAITIRLTKEMRDRIQAEARARNLSQTQYIIDCIEKDLKT